MKLLFWVQHLLGIGHVARAAVLTEALAEAGFDVIVAMGGMPVQTIAFDADVRQLTPVRATDQTFSELVAADGAPAATVMPERRAQLVALGEALRPDVILIEAWPFGRRPFTGELEALIAACPGARVAVSVRDILQTGRKPGRAEETRDRVNAGVDLVLVHSDARVTRLGDTFPLAGEITARVEHTGYVAPPATLAPAGEQDVVVSAGGGAFGAPLMRAAAEAAQALPDREWTLSTGPNIAPADRPEPGDNIVVVDYLRPLAAHLAGARVSVSQAGYNTTIDVLRAAAFGTRAVFVPSDVTGQSEQLARARALERAGAAVCLPESELTPERLAAAIEAAPEPRLRELDFDGATRSASLLAALA